MIYELGDRRLTTESDDWFVAPSASVIGEVHLGHDASVWFGAVIRGDLEPIRIGAGTNIQDNSVLHTDMGAPLVIGDHVTVGHKVMLHGCHIGDNALIGIGSVILNDSRIGKNCIVGANTLVTEGKEYPDGVLLIGAPAMVARDVTAQEIEEMQEAARRYVENGRRYRAELRSADVSAATP